jgi:hypothetical protein
MEGKVGPFCEGRPVRLRRTSAKPTAQLGSMGHPGLPSLAGNTGAYSAVSQNLRIT